MSEREPNVMLEGKDKSSGEGVGWGENKRRMIGPSSLRLIEKGTGHRAGTKQAYKTWIRIQMFITYKS